MARVKFFKNQTSNTSLVRINLHKKRIKKTNIFKKEGIANWKNWRKCEATRTMA
jgi:hypothetical protein